MAILIVLLVVILISRLGSALLYSKYKGKRHASNDAQTGGENPPIKTALDPPKVQPITTGSQQIEVDTDPMPHGGLPPCSFVGKRAYPTVNCFG